MSTFVRLLVAAAVLVASVSPCAAAGGLQRNYSSKTATRTVTGTIESLDRVAEVLIVNGGDGKRWALAVPERSDIDLGRFRVGDRVTATFAKVVTSTSVPRTKSRTHELLQLE